MTKWILAVRRENYHSTAHFLYRVAIVLVPIHMVRVSPHTPDSSMAFRDHHGRGVKACPAVILLFAGKFHNVVTRFAPREFPANFWAMPKFSFHHQLFPISKFDGVNLSKRRNAVNNFLKNNCNQL